MKDPTKTFFTSPRQEHDNHTFVPRSIIFSSAFEKSISKLMIIHRQRLEIRKRKTLSRKLFHGKLYGKIETTTNRTLSPSF